VTSLSQSEGDFTDQVQLLVISLSFLLAKTCNTEVPNNRRHTKLFKKEPPTPTPKQEKEKSYFNRFYAKMKNYAAKECFNLWLGNRQSLLLNTKANISII